jgi:hypothetical protein
MAQLEIKSKNHTTTKPHFLKNKDYIGDKTDSAKKGRSANGKFDLS